MRRLFRRFRLPTHPLFHIALLAVTLVTTTLFGGVGLFSSAPLLASIGDPRVWIAGMRFSIPLLFILGVHELGHMAACRYYGLPATYPYFIPAPVGIGTFGAVIRIRAPITEKRVLFDVGAAGPIAGFVATLPILVWGIATSHVFVGRPTSVYLEFGEPPLVRILERAFFPATAHGAELVLSGPGFAAWFGLLVTALNLLPLAQLDGGHILYAVAGRAQRPIAFLLFSGLLVLSFYWIGWLVWAGIVLVMGLAHPPTADESLPLDPKRRGVAAFCLLVFAVCFTPVPLRIQNPAPIRTPVKTYNL